MHGIWIATEWTSKTDIQEGIVLLSRSVALKGHWTRQNTLSASDLHPDIIIICIVSKVSIIDCYIIFLFNKGPQTFKYTL